ncbi:MAG: TrbC/VirB2 family protein [Candidatus Omnitrophica bacterium]|nr:TrbC/VirB2 family protein [Candidatus Omnitrophota bacterium]MCB9747940.1 TrbC/VirB2 family protein [Candidatus Omnitrophota bacterium]
MKLMKWFKKKEIVKGLLLAVALVGVFVHPAYADLEGSITTLVDNMKSISTPVAIILLIFAGWQRMMGNNQVFIAALVGTIIVFGAPQIVELINLVFN